MTPLSGLGLWVWMLSKCDRGKMTDIAKRLRASGVRWIAIKAGESHGNGQVTKAAVDFLRSMDIEVAAWWYSRPTTTANELSFIGDLIKNTGVQHLIMDAEIEWETVRVGKKHIVHNWVSEAREFAHKLRDKIGPDVYLADAPWAKPKSHPLFPFNQFGAVINARMPQYYWQLAGERADKYLPKCDAQWDAYPGAPVCPIGCGVDFGGTKHASLSEMSIFLDRYQDTRECVSLWSYQHISITEWNVLQQRATTPACPPDPDTI